MSPLTTKFGSLLLIGYLAAGAEAAMACGKGKLILEDKFETLDVAWDFAENVSNRSIGPGGLVYKQEPGDTVRKLNQSELYNNYEVCAVFATRLPADQVEASVGVVFWGSDIDNLYEAVIFPGWGSFRINRFQNGKYLSPVSATPNDAIHRGTDVTNEISVVVKANKATLAINGLQVIDFLGRPPEGGSLFGFTHSTRKNDPGPSTINLKSIQLREVEAEPKRSSK